MAVQLIIDMDDVGNVSVTGPLEARGTCYLMLEVAKDIIREKSQLAVEMHDGNAPPAPRIQVVRPGSIPPFPKQ